MELALVVPILLLLFAAAADLGRAFYAYIAVENAAKEGALFGSRNPICATATSSNLCDDPENAEYRINREAGTIAVQIAQPRCIAPDGTVRAATVSSPTANCEEGDTYVAGVSHDFRLITPILSQVVGTGLTLASESRSIVTNTAYDPTAGASPTLTVSWVPNTDPADCAELGGAPCFGQSPRANASEVQRTLTVESGTTPVFNLRVRNLSDRNLTNVTVTVRRAGTVFVPGTCTFPSTMATGYDSGNCTFSPATPVNWSGPDPDLVVPFTVTVDADQQEPSSDGVQVIVREPARVAVSVQAGPYREGGTGDGPWSPTPISGPSNLTVASRTAASFPGVNPEVWYFVRIENLSSTKTGRIEGFSLVESPPSGGPNAITTSCTGPFGAYSFPRDIAPGARLDCFVQRTRAVVGDTVVSASVSLAAGTVLAPSQPTSTVTVQACNQPNDRQVPMLVDRVTDPVAGTTTRYSVAEARTRWTAAGFTGGFTPAGSDGNRTLTQSQQAFSCAGRNVAVTVTHAP